MTNDSDSRILQFSDEPAKEVALTQRDKSAHEKRSTRGAVRAPQADEPDNQAIDPFPRVPEGETRLSDREFLRALSRLKALSAYLSQISSTPASSVRQAALLGGLNQLRPALDRKGRSAIYEEWSQVERRTQIIWAAMPEQQRRKFLTTQAPTWLSWVMAFFVVVAAVALVVAFILHWPQGTGSPSTQLTELPAHNLVPFLVWIMALGAIGGASSVGLNALSVQDDASFDISNSRLICLRLIIGALFGTVLTLPFGFGPFSRFLTDLGNPPPQIDAAKAAQQVVLLLIPFILGFSTSVVILVLNRMIEAVQTFFGKTSSKAQI
jgi:hypothetical protein